MWHIEYGADWADSWKISDKDWDRAMMTVSAGLADYVDRRIITQQEFIEGMEWVTGVVIEDHDVRIGAEFGALGIAVTLTD